MATLQTLNSSLYGKIGMNHSPGTIAAQTTNTDPIPLFRHTSPSAAPPPPPAPTVTGGDGTTTPTATIDPWAGTPWGSKAAFDQANNDYQTTKQTTMGSITDSIKNSGNQYNSSILDFIDSLTAGQRAIDNAGVQNEMAREQGRLGVLDMVGTGIRSGGVVLNNANATNSSAGEQIAKAYGQLGTKQMVKVGQQHALGKNNIQMQQDDLLAKTTTFKRHAQENKTSIVNGIVSDAIKQISALNATAQYASLPDRISIEAEKARIMNEAMASLSQYDSVLTDGITKTKPASDETLRADAYKLLNSGTAPDQSFNYTTSIPSQFQGTGPFAGNLPIFTSGA